MRSNVSALSRGLVLLACAAVLASGCSSYKIEPRGYKNNTYSTRNAGQPQQQSDNRQFGALSVNPGSHSNQFFEYSPSISKQLRRIDGISGAITMLTDRNAYVAIVFHRTAVRTKTGGRDKQEQDVGGTTEGVYNSKTGSPYWDNRQLATPYGSAMTVNDHSELPDGLKQAIALQVRKMAPLVKEVHISANSQFVNQFVEYSKKARLGESLTPYLTDFNTLVAKYFAAGNRMPTDTRLLDPATKGVDRNTGQKNDARAEIDINAKNGIPQ